MMSIAAAGGLCWHKAGVVVTTKSMPSDCLDDGGVYFSDAFEEPMEWCQFECGGMGECN